MELKKQNEFIENTANLLLQMADENKQDNVSNLPDYIRGMFDLCIAFMIEEDEEGAGYNSVMVMVADELEKLKDERDTN
ncbi:TPA: hypothetical protein TVB68_000909 [Streptococcus equi subsp. ruminatorum]|nr:hypothetical protein [Streptococcus equi subsp. ruminatorum]